jgi:tRNA dimethylallyltransferase
MRQMGMVVEIVSADSRQIYRHMNIGTDKVDLTIRQEIIHHQIDCVNPDQIYTAGQWKHDTDRIIGEITGVGHYPLIVWGTGLYIDTLYYNFTLPTIPANRNYRAYLEKLESDSPGILYQMLTQVDPVDAQTHHPHSTRFIIRSLEIYHQTWQTKSSLFQKQPLAYPMMMLGIIPSAQQSNIWIDHRIDQMRDWWLVQEVQFLLSQWYDRDCIAMNGIGYTQVIDYLDGLTNIPQCIHLIKQHTHQYAKKQRTRMRKYIRDMSQSPIDRVDYLIVDDQILHSKPHFCI